ncbi:hypothetical protein BH23VER1_BH23VER1_27400 [soil metagenome]
MDKLNALMEGKLTWAIVLTVILFGISLLILPPSTSVGQSDETEGDEELLVELAPYMGQLQTLTHKLALSIENSNHRLAEFYLYESLEALEEIKTEVPEYRGHPIALLVDQLATPTYQALATAIAEDKTQSSLTNQRATAGFAAVVESCNSCHAITKHEFIKIPPSPSTNPFLQDFKPSDQ